MDKDLELLHEKIDFLTEQVKITRRRQQEFDELKQDLTPVFMDLFKTAVIELDQISPHFSYEDLLYLLKKSLRNTRGFIAMLEQLESASDFVKDASPLSKDLFQATLSQLNEMEKKGYFVFFKGLAEILDRIVTSFGEEDLRQLGENIVSILTTVKQLTQPELMSTVQNAIAVYQNLNVHPPENTSLWAIAKHMNSPQVRRGIATGLEILRNLGEQQQQRALQEKQS